MEDAGPRTSAQTPIRALSDDPELVQERRQFIVSQALPLFAEKGFSRTSVRDITRACHMSIGSLYHYLGSKDDIGLLVAEQMRDEMLEFMGHAFDDPQPEESLRSVIAQWCRLCDRLQDNVLFLYREPRNVSKPIQKRIAEVDGQCIARFEEVLRRGVDAGVFRPMNARLFALNVYVCGNLWAFRGWYLGKFLTLDEYIEYQTDALLGSVLDKR